ncbi:hypothetical protein [Cryocola sp. 340MFSha3.1]|uniref:hypothetical protein n=1 Tax=Cryocola sp. 340MFSha3.1 TaxID=1169145 RepID=UPI0012DC2670|nr:hypothetical protein [Cryocola sp. 340MFSha3.1]
MNAEQMLVLALIALAAAVTGRAALLGWQRRRDRTAVVQGRGGRHEISRVIRGSRVIDWAICEHGTLTLRLMNDASQICLDLVCTLAIVRPTDVLTVRDERFGPSLDALRNGKVTSVVNTDLGLELQVADVRLCVGPRPLA